MARLSSLLWIIMVCVTVGLSTFSIAQAQGRPDSFADLVDKLSPTVVNVSTTQKVKNASGVFGLPFKELPNAPELEPFREFFERFGQIPNKQQQERDVYSLGSGVIIDPTGYIVTNNHVIDDAQEVTVTLSDDSKYKAKIVGRDKKTDLALLKVDVKKSLPAATIGDSDKMRVGDWVIAIGNPFGLGGSVTQGIISARQRTINAGPFDDFLQTDAPINRGNSGGPLFNLDGEVIGINTAIFSPSGGSIGIGFAIPTSLANPVISQLKQYGRTHRGWLGVKIQEVTDEAAESLGMDKAMGALVLDVTKGSPASQAGIQAGDVIIRFDDKDVDEMRFLPRMVAETKSGTKVTITVWREGSSKTMPLTVAEMDETEDLMSDASSMKDGDSKDSKVPTEMVMGMEVTPLTPSLRVDLGVDDTQNGLVVLEVDSGTETSKQGIRPGDVIIDVNNEPVSTIKGLKASFATARKAGRKYALVRILRNKETAFMTLPTSLDKD